MKKMSGAPIRPMSRAGMPVAFWSQMVQTGMMIMVLIIWMMTACLVAEGIRMTPAMGMRKVNTRKPKAKTPIQKMMAGGLTASRRTKIVEPTRL